jgi:hypothetical protein
MADDCDDRGTSPSGGLNEGLYKSQPLDKHGNYHVSSLPGLMLHVKTLWQTKIPSPAATFAAVRQMLENKSWRKPCSKKIPSIKAK